MEKDSLQVVMLIANQAQRDELAMVVALRTRMTCIDLDTVNGVYGHPSALCNKLSPLLRDHRESV
jgi:hypothetical protein